MKRLLSLVGLLIALALLVAACGTEALSRPDADATRIASSLTTPEETDIVEVIENLTEEVTEATEVLTEEATEEPTAVPTIEPTVEPTLEPTVEPTVEATLEVTEEVTEAAAIIPTTTSELPSEEAIAEAVAAADASKGENLFNVSVVPVCTTCHQVDGTSVALGPNLFGLRDTAVTRVPGQGPFTYVYNSIRNPHDFTVEGFPPNVMFDYDNVLTEQDVYDIIAYLWTLHD